ncbi:hypothetical protein [Bradyrhizobium sp. HKCCYLRH1062]|uniref:hypothetical protein n=1 Tax=unclassified Bradyrhizobium TaxID=2631580 RepID=UPI003EB72C52
MPTTSALDPLDPQAFFIIVQSQINGLQEDPAPAREARLRCIDMNLEAEDLANSAFLPNVPPLVEELLR